MTVAKTKRKKRTRALSIVHDGSLTRAEALAALQAAASAATEALPEALAKCKTDAAKQQVQNDRDTVALAYLNSLDRSLTNTSSQFEAIASQLTTEAGSVKQRAQSLQNETQAINLMTDLVRLAASLALAFGAAA
jgi:hypothetical protein